MNNKYTSFSRIEFQPYLYGDKFNEIPKDILQNLNNYIKSFEIDKSGSMIVELNIKEDDTRIKDLHNIFLNISLVYFSNNEYLVTHHKILDYNTIKLIGTLHGCLNCWVNLETGSIY